MNKERNSTIRRYMKVHHLRTPLTEEDVRRLEVGDIVYLSGLLVTARDMTHRLVIDKVRKGELSPGFLKGLVLYHAGPVVKRRDDRWEIIAVGPTTSMRMEPLEREFIQLTGVKLIVGKGGMGSRTRQALREFYCAYGIFPGGCGIVAAKAVKRVVDVYFLDELGIPEAMWFLEVENFGPIVIAMDSQGRVIWDEQTGQ